jgi:GTP-binding protein HflX
VLQTRTRPDPATYLGTGKASEVADLVRDRDAAVVIADDEPSPAQVRNLEDLVPARVVDRATTVER